MSADNWAECPRCLRRATEKRAKMEQAVEEDYGKVSAADWLSLKQQAEKALDLDHNLREDYCIYVAQDGEFVVGYRCQCKECGFEFEYDYKQQLNLSGSAKKGR